MNPSALKPLVAVTAALLAACSLVPVYERPPAPVAPAWADAGTTAGTAAAELDWADFLRDARLRRLVEIALVNNRDLRIAVLNVEQVRALYGVQRADRLPSVGLGASVNRSSAANSDLYSVGLTLSAFEVDLFGRVKSLSEAALARYLASDEGRRAAQMSLIAAVANTELALRAEAVVRRSRSSSGQLQLGDLRFERDRLFVGEAALRLPITELRLLSALAAQPNRTVPYADLTMHGWRMLEGPGSREMLKTTIYRLRGRLKEAGSSATIIATRGVGYGLMEGAAPVTKL